MRIISGKYKFYKIELDKKEEFAPISSFLRENIFNVLQPSLDWNKIIGADVFAGSGSLGLESLSRGAKFIYFNDLNPKNSQRIKENCNFLKIKNKEISQLHFLQFLLKLEQQKIKLDLVFIDPPFNRPDLIKKTIHYLLTNNLLNEGAFLIVVTPHLVNDFFPNLKLFKLKNYAKKNIYFFQMTKKPFQLLKQFPKSKFLIISGPSGVGKKQIIQNLINTPKFNLSYSISMTTRPKRINEVDTKDYFFLRTKQFEKLIDKNDFLEHAKFVNHYYGTSLSKTKKILESGKNILFETEIIGAENIKNKITNAVWIYIFPPSISELKKRLNKRSTENQSQINQRVLKAKKEMHYIKNKQGYDFFVINNEINLATKKIIDFLQKKFNSKN